MSNAENSRRICLSARLPRIRGRSGRGAEDRLRRGRDEVRLGRRRKPVRRDEPPRHDDEPDGGVLRLDRPDHDPGRGVPPPLGPRRDRARDPGRLRRLSAQAGDGHLGRSAGLLRLHRRGRARVPTGDEDHRRQRAEPTALLAADLRRRRQARVSGRDGGRARALLRLAQGVQPRDRRDRRRPLAARQRRPARDEQRLPLARALHGRPREGLPGQRADEAALRRVGLALLPERQHRFRLEGLSVAPDRLRQRGPGEAGDLGRVQRHGPARLRRVGPVQRHVRRARRDEPDDGDRRDRLAGRHDGPARATRTSRTCRRSTRRPSPTTTRSSST